MTYIERIHDVSTGEVTEREYTAAEIAEVEANAAKEAQRLLEAEAKASAKADLLDRLGITAEEAALLLA